MSIVRRVTVSRSTSRPARFALRALMVCAASLMACTDDAANMFNCYLAPDVPPVVIREDSATEAAKKCEQEQGQACTCSPVQTYRGIVSPD